MDHKITDMLYRAWFLYKIVYTFKHKNISKPQKINI